MHEARIDKPLSCTTALIAGGAGFIGRRIVKILRSSGVQVTIVSRNLAPDREIGSVALDILDTRALDRLFSTQQFDLIVNAAARIDQGIGSDRYLQLYHANTETAIVLMEAAARFGVKRFVHIGSNAEYGNAPCPQNLASSERPNSAYGVSKLSATRAVIAKSLSEGFPGIVVRPFLVFGPGENPNGLLGTALAAARSGSEFPTTHGDQTRDPLHVDAVAQDISDMALGEIYLGQIYNVCSGHPISVREILQCITDHIPSFAPRYGAIPYRPTELMASYGVPWRQRSRIEVCAMLRSHIAVTFGSSRN